MLNQVVQIFKIFNISITIKFRKLQWHFFGISEILNNYLRYIKKLEFDLFLKIWESF